MLPRSTLLACTAACAVLASACDRTPTDPSRPERYDVVFLGIPADAESFTPRAMAAGRVVGTARAGTDVWTVQWSNGTFSRIGPDVPAGCESEPAAAHVGFTVGQVTCFGPGEVPNDVYGWVTGVGALPRLFAEPYSFTDINRSATIVGTVNPPAEFPQASPRAFVVQGVSVTMLLPEGATGSEAVGISDEGAVAVTAYYDCTGQDDCAETRALVWSAGTWTEVDLPADADRSVAAGISPAGHLAGYTLGGLDGLFLYDVPDNDYDALPVVPGTTVQVTGVNAEGQVVGTGFRQSAAPGQQPSYGIIWGVERQFELTERIRGDDPWVITAALATDDEERIAALGFNSETGQEGPLLLVPPADS